MRGIIGKLLRRPPTLQPKKKNSKRIGFGRKTRIAIATATIASLGLLDSRKVVKLPPRIVEKQTHAEAEGELTLREHYKGTLGPFVKSTSDSNILKSDFEHGLHNLIHKNPTIKKDWNNLIKRIPEKYLKAIIAFPDSDTVWLTREQTRLLKERLNEYNSLFGDLINNTSYSRSRKWYAEMKKRLGVDPLDAVRNSPKKFPVQKDSLQKFAAPDTSSRRDFIKRKRQR